MMLQAIEAEQQLYGWPIGSPIHHKRTDASAVRVNSPCATQSNRLQNASVPKIRNVDGNPDKRQLHAVRWQQLLIGLLVSLIVHCAVFAWILPNGFSPMIAGSGEAANLSSGITTFDVLQGGEIVIDETTVEYVEDTKPNEVPETVSDTAASKPVEAIAEANEQADRKIPEQTPADLPEGGVVVDPDISEDHVESPVLAAIAVAKPTKANRQHLVRKKEPQETAKNKTAAKPAPEPKKSAKPQTRTGKKVAKTETRKKKTKTGHGGKSNASATKAGGRPGAKTNRAGGNAAASNYLGKVYAKIARTRRVHTGSKGSAHVRFKIAANGRLSAASVSRSSGNSKIDQAALAHIKRAAPFPKPPKGAKRTFVIPIEYRR